MCSHERDDRPPPTSLEAIPLEGLEREITELAAHINAATCRWLTLVRSSTAARAEDSSDVCELEHGGALHPETARRLGCDGSVVRILERDGRPLSVGRRTRAVPSALGRALRSRDRVCRFPGCSQRRWLPAHHVRHWARGGRTDLSNLVALYSFHHHLVHEGGYAVERGSGGGVFFRRPNGRVLRTVPPRPGDDRGELRRRHRHEGLAIDENTCGPSVTHDRFGPAWVVDGLAEADPRLRDATCLRE
jgi:hypothetical protein